MPNNTGFRNLENYLKMHEKRFIGKPRPRTLTDARRIAFGFKKSQHGMLGKTIVMK